MHRGKLLPEIERQIALLAERAGPLKRAVHAYLAGGMAVNFYTGSRMSSDVDIQWSERFAIPPDLRIFEVSLPNNDDVNLVTIDGAFGDYLGSFHPDWKESSQKIGDYGGITLHIISPLDLAVSKIARFEDRDKEDIEALSSFGFFTAREFEERANEAIEYYVGDTSYLIYNLRDALEMVKKYSHDECKPL